MTYQTLRYQKDGHKAIVTLNRPDVLNAINLDMEEELIDLWREIRYDHDVRAIVITGAGERAFCAGMDVRAERRRNATETSPIRRAGPRPASLLTPKQNDCFKPTIVAVNGVCAAAGFYFVAYGDIIICSDNASFVDPHSSNGLAPVVAQVLFAYRNIPYSYLMRLGLMGSHERTDAAKALDVGLVTEVVPQAQILERAVEIADIVSRNAPPRKPSPGQGRVAMSRPRPQRRRQPSLVHRRDARPVQRRGRRGRPGLHREAGAGLGRRPTPAQVRVATQVFPLSRIRERAGVRATRGLPKEQ